MRVIVGAKRVVGHGDGTAREGTPRSPSPPKRSDTAPTAHSHASTVAGRGRTSGDVDARLENGERGGPGEKVRSPKNAIDCTTGVTLFSILIEPVIESHLGIIREMVGSRSGNKTPRS